MADMSNINPDFNVAYAYSPRENVGSRGGNHIICTADFDSGRLHRKAGAVLCQPNKRWWGLSILDGIQPSCKQCLALAKRHDIDLTRVVGHYERHLLTEEEIVHPPYPPPPTLDELQAQLERTGSPVLRAIIKAAIEETKDGEA